MIEKGVCAGGGGVVVELWVQITKIIRRGDKQMIRNKGNYQRESTNAGVEHLTVKTNLNLKKMFNYTMNNCIALTPVIIIFLIICVRMCCLA